MGGGARRGSSHIGSQDFDGYYTSLDGNLFDSIAGMWSQDCCYNEDQIFQVELYEFHPKSSVDALGDSSQVFEESIPLFVETTFY